MTHPRAKLVKIDDGRTYLTLAEVAKYFRVDRRTLQKWIETEQFPVHVLGPADRRVTRVRVSDVREFERLTRCGSRVSVVDRH